VRALHPAFPQHPMGVAGRQPDDAVQKRFDLKL
jgi:hypothetical protein